MPPRKKAKLAYPLIKKDYRHYIEKSINVAGNWWKGISFGKHDTKSLCVVVDHNPIHKFPNKSTSHAMAVRVIDPLSAEERMTAKDDDDPEQYTRVYWMTIDAFSQFHDETHPNWNANSFCNEDAVPVVQTQDLTVTEDNPHIPAKKRVGRNLDGAIYRFFPVPMGNPVGRLTFRPRLRSQHRKGKCSLVPCRLAKKNVVMKSKYSPVSYENRDIFFT